MAGQKALMGLAVLSVMKNRNKTVAGNEFEADNRQPLASVSSKEESCTLETWLREAFFPNSLPYQEGASRGSIRARVADGTAIVTRVDQCLSLWVELGTLQ